MLGLADINRNNWDTLLGSAYPSAVNIRPTHPLNSDISTSDTIQLMYQHSQSDINHELIREAIQEIKDNANNEEDESELVERVFDYVKEKVQFVEDETILNELFGIDRGVELLIKPARLLSMPRPMGDCDDFSMLSHSLLSGLGIQSNFVTVAADKNNPKKWSHVYLVAKLKDGREIPIDTSHGKYVGWEAPNITRKDVWVHKDNRNREINNMYVNSRGMGCLTYDSEGNCLDPVDLGTSTGGDSTTILPPTVFPPPVGVTTANPTVSGTNWAAIFAPLANVGAAIAKAQFGQPQLAPGTFIRNADGSIVTNQPISGSAGGISLGTSLGTSLGGISPLMIAAVILVIALASEHK
jgi:hypothetical protein